MKILIGLILFSTIALQAQNITLEGKVTDAATRQPLPGANLILKGNNTIGTTANEKGIFKFTGLKLNDIIKISYVGYSTLEYKVTNKSAAYVNIELQQKVIPAQTVLIEGNVGKEGVTPLAFSKVTRKDIDDSYTLQDVPQYLGSLPSTTTYSENGNGLGYNYLTIRGFDQRRISVSINGIPQNDPEDHNVYWLDIPDLLASADLIQVQRGAGSGVTGYPAIGGSINIITSPFSGEQKQVYSAFIGSFNTRKYSASYSSGLIDNKYSIYANLSQTLSSGYRLGSWINFTSYNISAVRYDSNLTTQINFYGGPIADGLAYTGLPKFTITNKNLRTANYSYWEAVDNHYTDTLARRPTEIENFSQPHFELLNEYQLNDNVTINSALFMVIGNGFFDFDGSWADTTYLRLTHADGFNPTGNPGNALIRAEVDNTQYGWIPRVSIKQDNGELIIGGEFRIHRSVHWGSIDFAENLPLDVTKDYRYYYYRGGKDIANGFIHETYNLSDDLNLLGEVQLAYHKYLFYDEKYIGTDFNVSNLFFNPRLGINYRINEDQNVFLSFARVSNEPTLTNYYNADESSGGATPQFEKNPDGSYNFNAPIVQPETMNDIEFGTSINNNNLSASLNIFYMIFDNEIVANGKVDIYGQPVTGNVPQSLHRGIELAVNYKLNDGISVFANATYSKNIIKDGKYYISASEVIDLNGNRISGFPDFLTNAGITYHKNNFYLQLTGKYVGKFYSDNYDENLTAYLSAYPGFVDYTDNVNDAYFVANAIASYQVNLFNSLSPSKIYFQVNNIFDKLYSANAIGGEFFPAADRNFLAGLEIGL